MRILFSVLTLLLFCTSASLQAQACLGFDGMTGSYGANNPSQFGQTFHTENGISLAATGFQDETGNVSNTAHFWAGTFLYSGAFTLANTNFIKSNPDANLQISVIAASEITFDVIDWNSYMNFSVNGGPITGVDNLLDLPTNVAPGVTLSLVTDTIGPGFISEVTLTGYITEVIIGGDDFGIDNICFVETTPICLFSNLTTTASACDQVGNFSAEIDFNYSEEGNNGFTITGNGTSYGTFDYAQLPISIDSLFGDGTTVYEFTVQDVDNPNCSLTGTLGVVTCPICTISNISATPDICVDETYYTAIVNFDYANTAGLGFDIHLNGVYLEYWTYAELPIELYLPTDGGSTHMLTFCDENSATCCSSVTIDQLNCAPPCAITQLSTTAGACNLQGEFMVDLDMAYENEGTTFTVAGNGINYGTYLYTDLPISIGPLEGDNSTTYEFNVTDGDDPNCTAVSTVGPIDCPVCAITQLSTTASACDLQGSFTVDLDMVYENGGSSFTVTGNGTSYGTFLYTDLPITLGPLAGDNSTTYNFFVSDSNNPDCTAESTVGPIDCPVCSITQLSATASACNLQGEFTVDLDMVYENADSSFTVTGNGTSYGTFLYAELPITLGPLAGDNSTTYEFNVKDSNDPSCTAFSTVGPIDCPVCSITQLTTTTSACNLQGEFTVELDMVYENEGSTFTVTGNGGSYGTFLYADLPITLGPLAGDNTTTYEFNVTDSNDPNCTAFSTVGPIDCPVCDITQLTTTVSVCNMQGEFTVDLDMVYENAGSSFTVTGNGGSYGTFLYADLPITLGPLVGDNTTTYNFFVSDSNDPDCTAESAVGPIDCPLPCTMEVLNANALDCTSDVTYDLFIDLNASNTGSTFTVNAVTAGPLGTYSYGTSPLTILDVHVNPGQMTETINICDDANPNCCSSWTYDTPNCIPAVCEIANISTQATACDSNGNFMAVIDFDYGSTGTQFSVVGNGTSYGTFLYTDLPITLGPLAGDNSTTYEFIVTDSDDPDCTALSTVGPIDCPLPCTMEVLNSFVLDCTSDITYNLLLDLNASNTGTTFTVNAANAGALGTYSYGSLPLTIFDINVSPGQATETINICDDANPNCCTTWTYDTPNCTPAVCEIGNISAQATACDSNGNFMAVIDFDYANTSTQFSVAGNGVSYGTYFYAELPITLGPLAGDNTTTYEFIVTDGDSPNCTAFTTVGPIDCQVPCSIQVLNANALECTSDTTYNLLLNLGASNTGTTFTVNAVNGGLLGTYSYASLPVTINDVIVNPGQVIETINICDDANPNCCTTWSYDTPNCMTAVCEIANISTETTGCDSSGNFMVVIDFDYANTSTQFSVVGNGVSYGSYTYASLPITLGPFLGDGVTDYTFEIQDANNTNCEDVALVEAVECNTQVCGLSNLTLDPLQCTSDSTFSMYVDFDYENVGSNGFDIYIGSGYFGFYDYGQLPLSVINIPSSDLAIQTMTICDVENPGCCVDADFNPLNCTPSPCELGGLELGTEQCDSNGMFYVVLDFEYANTSMSFTVAGNGANYGTFNYADLPAYVGPLVGDGTTSYEFIVTDMMNPNCTLVGEIAPVNCSMDCELFELIADPGQCTSDSTFSLYLDFDFANVSSGSFNVMAQGSFIGNYSYGSLPLDIQDFPSMGTSTVQLTVCDEVEPNCCVSTTFESIQCDNICNIFAVTAEPTQCDQGLFLVELDLDYQNPGLLGFQVFGNGSNYGNFSYDDLPITIGALAGDGVTEYEFVVVDLTNSDCSNFTTIDPIDCLEQCTMSDLIVTPFDCVNDSFTVALTFTHNNTSAAGYRVTENGTDLGTFMYDGPVAVVGPFYGDGNTVYQFEVTDLMNADCTLEAVFDGVDCISSSVGSLVNEGVSVRYNYVGEQIVVNMEQAIQEDSEITIYDGTGRLMITSNMAAGENDHLVDVSNLGSGFYVCQLRNSKGRISQTFVRIQ